jgi:hypothetical protein
MSQVLPARTAVRWDTVQVLPAGLALLLARSRLVPTPIRFNSHTSHEGGKGAERPPSGGSPPSSLSRTSHDHVTALHGASGGHYQRQPSGSSPLSGNSPGTTTPPEGAGISRLNSLNSKALRKSWESQVGGYAYLAWERWSMPVTIMPALFWKSSM